MKEIPINLDGLKKEDLYSVATALLYTLKDCPKYSVMSELFYILDRDNFIKMIKYFGGQEIRIPSSEEISEMLTVLLLYQYREVEGMDWSDSMRKAEVPEELSKVYRSKVNSLRSLLEEISVGRGDLYDES